MSSYEDDGLWPYFVPLWRGIRSVSSEVVLAGGYGLFLKHNWLLSLEGELADHQGNQLVGDRGDAFQVNVEPTLIEIQHWSQLEPRATKDFDFIVSIDLIASEQAQRRVAKVLREHEPAGGASPSSEAR